MAIAETDRSRLVISEETTWAETPSSPAMTEVPRASGSPDHTKETSNTATIRSDSQVNANVELGAGALGDVGFELIYEDYDLLFKGVMRNVFTTATVTLTTISFDAASQEVRDSASGFTTAAGYIVNSWVKISGAYNSVNNGLFRVTTRTDGALTLANGAAAVIDESAGETITVIQRYMRNSTNNYSFLMEKQFLDITKYIYYPGAVIGTMNLVTNARAIITGTFGTQAKQGIPLDSSISGSIVDATGNDQVTASANVGSILLDGATLAVPIRNITLNADNGLRERPQVGTKYTNDFGRGQFTVSGTVEAYFEDHTLYNKLVDHTAVMLSWRVTDVDGNVNIFTVPKVYFNSGAPDTPGVNTDIPLNMNFDAPVNKATGYGFTLEIAAFDA